MDECTHTYTHFLRTTTLDEKPCTYKETLPYSISIFSPRLCRTMAVFLETLWRSESWTKQKVIPFRTKTPLEEKQSKWLTERERKGKDREREGGGGKSRQQVRGRAEERGRASARANVGGKKNNKGASRDQEIGTEKEGWDRRTNEARLNRHS